jgi:PAS domain S-box
MISLPDIEQLLPIAVACMLIGTFIMLFYTIYIYYKEQETDRESVLKNAQLAAVMRPCHIRIYLMYPFTNRYIMLSEDGTEQETFSPIDFARFYQHEDFEAMRQQVLDIRDGKLKQATCRIRGRQQKDGRRRTYEANIRILKSDKTGRPKIIIGLLRDITERLEKQENVNKLLMLYHTFFESSIIDTMYYDKDGFLKDLNNKACETFGIKDRQTLLSRGMNLKDVPAYRNLDIHNFTGYRMSSITDIDMERCQVGAKIPEITRTDKIYYDTIANPLLDDQGHITGIYTAGYSINEMVESFHRQQESTRLLQEATQHIQDYIDNINLALRVSEVRLMNYQPDTHELEISNNLTTAKLRLTQIRCLKIVSPEHRNLVAGLIRKMDRREKTRIDVTFHTTLHDKKGRDVWLTFSIIPMEKADGTVSHYFGMCRNETEMMETAELLKAESQKAQETELLKDAFLQNMSHEIRTPLSAVIGFAELLTSDHDPAEEAVFINHIKTNSDLLLQLVNDVLFISRLDAHMVEINKHPADFALLFECWCNMGWTDHQPGVNVITENPYNHLMINIDETNLALVIQKLCACAAQNTSEGFIRAKYEYRNGMLIIKVDDTGKGLDAENQKRVFDRFNRNLEGKYCGTGLVLPIIKELTEQMGGTIEFQSEPGKGSTIWVTVPCEATTSERKTT